MGVVFKHRDYLMNHVERRLSSTASDTSTEKTIVEDYCTHEIPPTLHPTILLFHMKVALLCSECLMKPNRIGALWHVIGACLK